ncbi:MAG: LacI family DNA-binding transcriptional regulator [Lacunisphaera sp.]|jgi:LacI family transcriptional regulator|nr:LacI family DNA-binding transcriptional regulator [Lacunisphaera sp.]
MAKPPAPKNLQAIARAAGVSAMTVSRVLRNFPRVAASTRRAVLQAAKKLGYTPDPHMARLMARVRSHRRRRAEAVIALVRDEIPGDELLDHAYQYVALHDIRVRAERHGYRAEEFRLDRHQMSAGRLAQILETRGIEGLIISPQSSHSIGMELDYSRFAAVTLGYGLQQPALHRASTNMTRGILQATAELAARGYRRIGLAVTQWVDARSDHTYSGAMLTYQQAIAPRDRVPLLLFPENNLAHEFEIFRAWFRRHRPDAIISFDSYVPDWLTQKLNLRIPEQVGVVVHDWVERHRDFAGIHHRRAQVAAAAVDMLATLLMQNERGVPDIPRQTLIPPAWVDGPSIRSR